MLACLCRIYKTNLHRGFLKYFDVIKKITTNKFNIFKKTKKNRNKTKILYLRLKQLKIFHHFFMSNFGEIN